MKMKDISKLSDVELNKQLGEKRAQVRQFRFDVSGSKAKNLREGRNMRKDVARMLTELNARAKA